MMRLKVFSLINFNASLPLTAIVQFKKLLKISFKYKIISMLSSTINKFGKLLFTCVSKEFFFDSNSKAIVSFF